MIILAIDSATSTGWATGEPGGTPRFGVKRFGAHRTNGQVIAEFYAWLRGLCDETGADLICFESPYIPQPRYRNARFDKAPPMNPLVLRRLFALVGIVEAVAHERQVECFEATPSEISKFFLGNARQGGREAKKAATIKMCRLYGWTTPTDDEADALALFCMAEHQVAPQIGSRRTASAGRELPIHGTLAAPIAIPEKNGAPRGETARHRKTASGDQAKCQTRFII
jgi:hypothetical protein